MTKITIFKNKENEYVGFDAVGHSGYAEFGEDIVCSAISILIINTINSIETFIANDFSLDSNEDGFICFRLTDKPSDKTTLLLDSMVLGLQTMEEDDEYAKFIDLIFEEV